jgi:hypothetical protein
MKDEQREDLFKKLLKTNIPKSRRCSGTLNRIKVYTEYISANPKRAYQIGNQCEKHTKPQKQLEQSN